MVFTRLIAPCLRESCQGVWEVVRGWVLRNHGCQPPKLSGGPDLAEVVGLPCLPSGACFGSQASRWLIRNLNFADQELAWILPSAAG